MKRRIYSEMIEWKSKWANQYALMIEGARRVGKSYIVEEFVRQEYAQMLQNQLAKGNNGLTKTKFITFGVEAENIKTAKPRLERIEIDLLNNFKRLGVAASPLDGKERLKLIHDMFHMDTHAPFQFDWKWLAPTGLSTKDFVAPSSFDFHDKNNFGMGSKQGDASLYDYAKQKNTEVANALRDQIETTIAAIEKMQEPFFTTAGDAASKQAVEEAGTRLTEAIAEVKKLL